MRNGFVYIIDDPDMTFADPTFSDSADEELSNAESFNEDDMYGLDPCMTILGESSDDGEEVDMREPSNCGEEVALTNKSDCGDDTRMSVTSDGGDNEEPSNETETVSK